MPGGAAKSLLFELRERPDLIGAKVGEPPSTGLESNAFSFDACSKSCRMWPAKNEMNETPTSASGPLPRADQRCIPWSELWSSIVVIAREAPLMAHDGLQGIIPRISPSAPWRTGPRPLVEFSHVRLGVCISHLIETWAKLESRSARMAQQNHRAAGITC
ncbi:hypothetical protein PG997_001773 [Apiospora hydei]|uniref:Uncharacterized protein n=1 Tax=Apiospora hydei TaxID=1337664 RepID=A0ABR1XEN7_9PEZI